MNSFECICYDKLDVLRSKLDDLISYEIINFYTCITHDINVSKPHIHVFVECAIDNCSEFNNSFNFNNSHFTEVDFWDWYWYVMYSDDKRYNIDSFVSSDSDILLYKVLFGG